MSQNHVCNICGSNSLSFKYRISNFSYYLCSYCFTLQLIPLPSTKSIKRYYAEQFNYSAGLATIARIRARANKILKKIHKIRPDAKTLLDVGSGLGILIDEANKYGIKSIGIEPSSHLHFLSTQITQNSMNIDLEEYSHLNKKFDVITSIHVIEHVPDPYTHMQTMCKLLNPKGLIFLETPNLNSHLYHFQKEKYTFLTPPDHLYIFSPKSFAVMLNSNIYKLKYSTYSHSEHLMGIVKSVIKSSNAGSNDASGIIANIRNTCVSSKYKRLKYQIIDLGLAKICTPMLNIMNRGSFLEMLVRKQI